MKTFEGNLVAQNMKVAIVAARFNEFITSKLIGGAMDGLTPHGPNQNRGAEALLAYLLAWQALVEGVFPQVDEGVALGRVFALGGRP